MKPFLAAVALLAAGSAASEPAIDEAALKAALQKGTVKVVEPLGPHQLVSLQVDGRLFRAVLDNHHRIRPGEDLVLAPKADRVRWFDAETGVAIG